MAEYTELYARAHWYDIALGRDVGREIDFVTEVFRRLAGRPLSSVLEIACGPGYHTRGFARRGIAATGLDLMPGMVELGRRLAEAEGLVATWVAADMRDFRLAAPVDAVLTMYDALDCLVEQDDVIAHFRNVAANLVLDGLYILEFTHPHDTGFADYGSFSYEGERDGTRVVVDWATNGAAYHPLTMVAEVEVTMTVTETPVGRTGGGRELRRFRSRTAARHGPGAPSHDPGPAAHRQLRAHADGQTAQWPRASPPSAAPRTPSSTSSSVTVRGLTGERSSVPAAIMAIISAAALRGNQSDPWIVASPYITRV